MHHRCVNCAKLGTSCAWSRFFALSAKEVIDLCKERKTYLGLSNGRIAELANMSKGTVDGLFANAHGDFRYETIRPVLNVLFGGNFENKDFCSDVTDNERTQYEERIKQLENEIKWREDKIQHLTKNNESMQTLITNTNARNTKSQEFLQGQVRSKNKTIIALSICLGISLAIIIAALIVDRLNSGIGFFWLESLLHRETGNTIKRVSKLIEWSM